MPIVIDNPEIEARLSAFANAWGTDLLQALTHLLDEFDTEQEDKPLTPEDIASLKRGAADSEAGRVSDGRANLAQLKALVTR